MTKEDKAIIHGIYQDLWKAAEALQRAREVTTRLAGLLADADFRVRQPWSDLTAIKCPECEKPVSIHEGGECPM